MFLLALWALKTVESVLLRTLLMVETVAASCWRELGDKLCTFSAPSPPPPPQPNDEIVPKDEPCKTTANTDCCSVTPHHIIGRFYCLKCETWNGFWNDPCWPSLKSPNVLEIPPGFAQMFGMFHLGKLAHCDLAANHNHHSSSHLCNLIQKDNFIKARLSRKLIGEEADWPDLTSDHQSIAFLFITHSSFVSYCSLVMYRDISGIYPFSSGSETANECFIHNPVICLNPRWHLISGLYQFTTICCRPTTG